MNKWIIAPLLTLFLLGGCASPSPTPPEQAPVDMHNAMNALDYTGIYRAITPPKKAGFLEIELKPDEKFRLLTVRQEEKTGTYIWEKSGSVIQLVLFDDRSPRFFVGEGFLRHEEKTGIAGQILRKE